MKKKMHSFKKSPKYIWACLVSLSGLSWGSLVADDGSSTEQSTFNTVLTALESQVSIDTTQGNSFRPLERYINVPELSKLLPLENVPDEWGRLDFLKDDSVAFMEKSKLLHSLRHGHVEESESIYLLYYLAYNEYIHEGGEDMYALSLMNDALECLLEQAPMHEGLGSLMLAIVRDGGAGPIWREYVLQHFDKYYRAYLKDSDGEGLEMAYMQQALAAALYHQDSGLAGTALIVLEKLRQDYDEFQGASLRTSLLRLAVGENAELSSRVTALAMLGSMQEPTSQEIAFAIQYAGDSTSPLVLRMASVGCLKRWAVKNEQAREGLVRLHAAFKENQETSPSNTRMRTMLQSALSKLDVSSENLSTGTHF